MTVQELINAIENSRSDRDATVIFVRPIVGKATESFRAVHFDYDKTAGTLFIVLSRD